MVQGLGFILTVDRKDELITHDPRNWEVIRPYVIGERPKSASRLFGEPVDHQLP